MINEYNKGGAFKEYVDKAVRCNGTSPEVECQKVVTKEYFKSLQKGEVNEDTIGDAVSGTDTIRNSYKPACDC